LVNESAIRKYEEIRGEHASVIDPVRCAVKKLISSR